MPNLMTHISREFNDTEGFWKQVRKWMQSRFPKWNIG